MCLQGPLLAWDQEAVVLSEQRSGHGQGQCWAQGTASDSALVLGHTENKVDKLGLVTGAWRGTGTLCLPACPHCSVPGVGTLWVLCELGDINTSLGLRETTKASEGLQEGPSGGGVTQELWRTHLLLSGQGSPSQRQTVSPRLAFPTLPGGSLPCPPERPALLPGPELVVSSLEPSAWAHLQ